MSRPQAPRRRSWNEAPCPKWRRTAPASSTVTLSVRTESATSKAAGVRVTIPPWDSAALAESSQRPGGCDDTRTCTSCWLRDSIRNATDDAEDAGPGPAPKTTTRLAAVSGRVIEITRGSMASSNEAASPALPCPVRGGPDGARQRTHALPNVNSTYQSSEQSTANYVCLLANLRSQANEMARSA